MLTDGMLGGESVEHANGNNGSDGGLRSRTVTYGN